MGALKSFESPHYAPGYFPENCNGLLFRSILRMCVQKLKFVALPVPEKIGGTPKIWAVPGYAHAPFSPKFVICFCSHGPSEYICQIWRSYSFTHSWDNTGYFKKLGSPWICPRSLFFQILRALFAWTLWIYLPNLKFVALSVPEIIGGTQNLGQSLYTPSLHFFPNF